MRKLYLQLCANANSNSDDYVDADKNCDTDNDSHKYGSHGNHHARYPDRDADAGSDVHAKRFRKRLLSWDGVVRVQRGRVP